MSHSLPGTEYKGPSSAPGRGPKQPDGNPAALYSFILGVLMCVPLVTSLGAVLLGVVGLRKSRHPMAGGRSLALFGLALGIVGLVIWSSASGFIINRWITTAPQRQVATRFIHDLSVNDIPAATAATEPAVGPKRIQKWNDRLGHLGTLNSVQVRGIFYDASGNDSEWTLTGRALYSRGVAPFSVTVVKHPDGWKVRKMDLKGGTPT